MTTGPDLVRDLRERGYSWHVVARALNQRAVPTPTGVGRWWPQSAMRHFDPTARETWRRYIAARRHASR